MVTVHARAPEGTSKALTGSDFLKAKSVWPLILVVTLLDMAESQLQVSVLFHALFHCVLGDACWRDNCSDCLLAWPVHAIRFVCMLRLRSWHWMLCSAGQEERLKDYMANHQYHPLNE
jgi:hypothetical protein